MEYSDDTIASLASLIAFHNELEKLASVDILSEPIRKIYPLVLDREILGITSYFSTRYSLSSHQQSSYLTNISQVPIFN